MRIREHRAMLKDSMDTEVTIEPTMDSVVEWVQSVLYPALRTVTASDITFSPFGYDRRLERNQYLVIMKGYGVVGIADDDAKLITEIDYFVF